MRNGKLRNEANPALRGFVERLDVFVFDLIFALNLFDDELRVGIDVKLFAPDENRVTDRANKCGVLSKVVRAGAEILGDAHNAGKMDTDPGFTRITARASVDVSLKLHL